MTQQAVVVTPSRPERAALLVSHIWEAAESWTKDAACADPGYDPEWWFEGGYGADIRTLRAKLICASCPVLERCRSEAREGTPGGAGGEGISLGGDHGIWGGLTQRERQRLRTGAGELVPPAEVPDDVDRESLAWAITHIVDGGGTIDDVRAELGRQPFGPGRGVYDFLKSLTYTVPKSEPSSNDTSVGEEGYGEDTATEDPLHAAV